MRLGAPLVDRQKLSVLFADTGVQFLYVVGTHHEELVSAQGARCQVEPGLLKMKLQHHPTHPLIRAIARDDADLVEVFDCTLGVGHDAMHVACALNVRVVATERSAVLCALHEDGLVRAAVRYPAIRNIDVICGDAAVVLAARPDRSIDVVMLDPMMLRAKGATPTFDALRALADHAPASAALYLHAARVAKRRVVLKRPRRVGVDVGTPLGFARVEHGAHVSYHIHDVVP